MCRSVNDLDGSQPPGCSLTLPSASIYTLHVRFITPCRSPACAHLNQVGSRTWLPELSGCYDSFSDAFFRQTPRSLAPFDSSQVHLCTLPTCVHGHRMGRGLHRVEVNFAATLTARHGGRLTTSQSHLLKVRYAQSLIVCPFAVFSFVSVTQRHSSVGCTRLTTNCALLGCLKSMYLLVGSPR